MAGKFEVYRDKAGKFRFRLKAANGQIIATGEAYESKAALLSGIESIRSNAAAATLVDMADAPTPGPKPSPPPAPKPGPPPSPKPGPKPGPTSTMTR